MKSTHFHKNEKHEWMEWVDMTAYFILSYRLSKSKCIINYSIIELIGLTIFFILQTEILHQGETSHSVKYFKSNSIK